MAILRGWKTTKCHLQRKHMSSSFKASHPVVKRSKKLFDFIWFYFISFEVLKMRCFDAKKIALFWFYQSIPLLSPPGCRPTRIYAHQKRPDMRRPFSGPIFGILRYIYRLILKKLRVELKKLRKVHAQKISLKFSILKDKNKTHYRL